MTLLAFPDCARIAACIEQGLALSRPEIQLLRNLLKSDGLVLPAAAAADPPTPASSPGWRTV